MASPKWSFNKDSVTKVYYKALDNWNDVKRVYWTTYNIHSEKSLVPRIYNSVVDTVKSIVEYNHYSDNIIHKKGSTVYYSIPYQLKNEDYLLVLACKPKILQLVKAVKVDFKEEEKENVTDFIKKIAGPNEDFHSQKISPFMLGWHGVKIYFINKETLDEEENTFVGTEVISFTST